jgi:DNA-binding CsgD family transcriptional regulator
VAVVSALDDPLEAVRALESGADGLLPATLAPDVATNALAFILTGGTFFPPEALRAASGGSRLGGVDRRARAGRHDLTPRQQDVLELLGRGLANKCIARQLDMQESTVKVHVRQIMHKLGVSNRTQVALIAASDGDAAAAPGSEASGVTVTAVARVECESGETGPAPGHVEVSGFVAEELRQMADRGAFANRRRPRSVPGLRRGLMAPPRSV